MTSTEQLKLSAGVYNIVLTFGPPGFDGRLLTDGEGYVTISPPNEVPDPRQEWLVTPVKDKEDFVIIERAYVGPRPLLFTYLTYKGAPVEPPKKGDQIEVNSGLTPFNEWRLGLGPGFTDILLVDHSKLGIAFGLNPLPDPILVLNDSYEDQLKWRFSRVRDE